MATGDVKNTEHTPNPSISMAENHSPPLKRTHSYLLHDDNHVKLSLEVVVSGGLSYSDGDDDVHAVSAFVMAAGKLWNTISEEGTLKLVFITKASPPQRNLVVQNNEAIPTILSLLKSSTSTLERPSLPILFNLSLNPNLKLTFADIETIQNLNDVILYHGSLESRKLAASLICSLAMLDKNKAAVSRPDGPVTRHLLSSLTELVHFHGNCTLAVRSVENVDCEDLSGNALVILELLFRFNEGLKALTNTPSIVSKMFDVLKSRCMLNNEGAAESEECLRDALGLPDLMFVLAELSVRGSIRVREKASLLLRKLEANESYSEDN
ncbi:Armadillo-like helical, partial [Cynara cardunculus var. scolymus]